MDNLAVPIPPISPQPVVSSLPDESSSRRWFLWFAGGLAILIFGTALGIFSAKFFSESPSPSQLTSTPSPTLLPIPSLVPDLNREPTGSAATADWKTYTNKQFNYSFKHPPSWEFDRGQANSSDEELSLITHIYLYDRFYNAIPRGGFIVSVSKKSNVYFVQSCSEVESCAKKAMSYHSFPKTISPIYVRRQFLGIDAIVATYDLPDLYVNSNKITRFSRTFFLKDGDLYEIITHAESDQYTEFKQIFDQILSTFKFISPSG